MEMEGNCINNGHISQNYSLLDYLVVKTDSVPFKIKNKTEMPIINTSISIRGLIPATPALCIRGQSENNGL